MTVYHAMISMFDAARTSLTEAELEAVSDMTDAAANQAQHLARVTEGIAMLVNHDGEAKTGAGNFQDSESVFPLLCGLSHSFETIAAMAEVGGRASYELIERKEREAKA